MNQELNRRAFLAAAAASALTLTLGREASGHEPEGHGPGELAPHAHGRDLFKRYGLVASHPGYKEFNIRLRRFAYEPSTLRVDLGDRVQLNLDAVDEEHGFSIDGYPVNVRVPEEGYQRVEFVASREGAFRIRCSVTCGPFHPFMIGRLVVGRNRPFWVTAAFFLLAPAAVLAYLVRNGGTEDER
jgi:cytochrome c oxidase subunit 2